MSKRPADKIKLPYMSKAQNRWYASIRLPKDVQAAFGGMVIVKHFMGLTDQIAAYRAAKPVIEGWQLKISICHIQPEKPQQNAYIERSNRTVRHKWLDQNIITKVD